MKPMVKAFIVSLVLAVFFVFGRVDVIHPVAAKSRQLSGEAAQEFLAQEGILAQLEVPGPQGRNFDEPPPTTASDGAPEDWFGFSVAVDGDTVVVGAPQADVGVNSDQGAVYIFIRLGSGWSQLPRLVATDGAAGDLFGSSVALQGDTFVVGAPIAAVDGNLGQGAAYVFSRSGISWSEQDKLMAEDGVSGDLFGNTVALDGDTVIVGAAVADVNGENDQGAAYVFTRSGTSWSEQDKLLAGDGDNGDQFGNAVVVEGDTVVVGASWADMDGNNFQGAAYVFTRSGISWSEQDKLLAGDGEVGDFFGTSVELAGDTVVVGAQQADVSGEVDQGAAYVFTRSGTSWSEQDKLLAEDGLGGDRFGNSLALDGDTLVIGAFQADVGGVNAQGATYIFTHNGTNWGQAQKLAARDGETGDRFGVSVALSGDTLVIGARQADVAGDSDVGKVYLAARGPVPWPQTSSNEANDGGDLDNFGISVAIDGDTAIVGARGANVGGNNNRGAAYIFIRFGSVWVQQAKLTAADGAFDDNFGISVAVDGDTAVIGASQADIDGAVKQGAAYVFTRSGVNWNEQDKLMAMDGMAEDRFGRSVAVDGDTVVVGAYSADVGANIDQGAAYFFTRNGSNWSEQDKVVANGGGPNDSFGYAVSLDGDTTVIGAMEADIDVNVDQGAVYVFTRNGTAWEQEDQLLAEDGAAGDLFGYSVALEGDTAVVGARWADVDDEFAQGAAYVFARSGVTWGQQQKLVAGDGAAGHQLGVSVALDGERLVVGAWFVDVGGEVEVGAAYVFTKSGSSWSQEQKLLSADGKAGDRFGQSVGLSDDTAIVGAYLAEVGGDASQGRVYFFERQLFELYLPTVVRE